MTDDLDAKMTQLAILWQQRDAATDPSVRAAMEAAIAMMEASIAPLAPPDNIVQTVSGTGAADITGNVTHSPVMTGDENTVIQSGRDTIQATTVQQFFGTATPGEDQATLLTAYLTSLTSECQQLRLSRLTSRQQTGAEQSATPQLRLQAVYTGLTTSGAPITLHQREYPAAQPFNTCTSIPFSASDRPMVPSPDAEAISPPPGDQATSSTHAVW